MIKVFIMSMLIVFGVPFMYIVLWRIVERIYNE